MKSLTAITIISVAVMIMASAGYYFYNNSINESSYPSYHVDMHLNTTIPVPYYPIQVDSNLTGNGTYQQLLTFSDPSHYGINANGSNLAFYDGSNNTHLYAWIQSMNSTSMQVWIKNYNSSSVIDMQVLPSFENLFSATGYLGEAPQLSVIYGQYDNGANVFPFYYNFKGNALNTSIWQISNVNYTVNNGITIRSLSGGAIIVTKSSMPNENNSVIDFNGKFTVPDLFVNGSSYGLLEVGYYPNGQTGLGYYNNTDAISLGEFPVTMDDLTNYPLGTNATFSVWHNQTNEFSMINNTDEYEAKWSYSGTPNYIGFMSNHASENDSVTIYWIDYRTLPTDGKMPTFTIGTAKSLTPQYLFNINTVLNFMNTVLNNVNFNLSSKIQFLQSELNNTNLNITTKINYVDSLVNHTTNNIILQLAGKVEIHVV